jgi:transposase
VFLLGGDAGSRPPSSSPSVNRATGCVGAATAGGHQSFEPKIYKQRNTVERAINNLKGYRAVATRYDKRDYIFRGTIYVTSIKIWLRYPRSMIHRPGPSLD